MRRGVGDDACASPVVVPSALIALEQAEAAILAAVGAALRVAQVLYTHALMEPRRARNSAELSPITMRNTGAGMACCRLLSITVLACLVGPFLPARASHV
jgi:hypothetical protein